MFNQEIIGGLLIGFASALPMLFEGRIAGVSGYASSALRPNNKEGKTGLVLVLGIFLSSFIWKFSGGALPQVDSSLSLGTWAVAGLLVGFGSRLGGGCTSGHGVCGLGRMSPRSFASVLIFMSAAIITQFIMSSFL